MSTNVRAARLLVVLVVAWAALLLVERFARAQWQGDTVTKPSFASISSATGVSISGGTMTVSGVGFTASSQTQICAHPCTRWITPNPPATYISQTAITAVIPALDAGSYDLLVSDNGGFLSSAPAIFNVTNTMDPSTCAATFAAGSLIGWYRADGISGSTWTDRSSFSQDLSVTGSPTVTPADSNFNSQPTVTFSGAGTDYALSSGFSVESGSTIWVFVVSRNTGNSFPTAAAYNGGGADSTYFRNDSQIPLVFENATGAVVSWGTSEASTPIGWYGYATGSTGTIGVRVGIASPEVSNTGTTFSIGTGGTFSIAIDPTASSVYAFEGQIADVIVLNVSAPTVTGYYECLYAYANFRYGLDAFPSILGVTPVGSAGGPIRVEGSGFEPNATVTTLGSTLSTSFNSSASVGATVPMGAYPAGFYNLTVTNPDSEETTAANVLSVVPIDNPWTILGASAIAWFRADQIASTDAVPRTGSPVTGFLDLSRLANDAIQSSGANEPTWVSANAAFGGQPTVHFAGSQWLTTAVFNTLSATDLYVWAVYNINPASCSYCEIVTYESSFQNELRTTSGTTPEWIYGGGPTVVDWGSALAGTTQAVLGFAQDVTTSTEPIGIDVNNSGSPVTSTSTSSVLPNGGALGVGARPDGSVSSDGLDVAEIVIANAAPSGTQLTQMQTYFHVTRGYF